MWTVPEPSRAWSQLDFPTGATLCEAMKRHCVRGVVTGSLLLLLPASVTGQTDEEIEEVFWQSVVCERAREVRLYLETYPTGRYVTEAWVCLEQQLGLDRAARRLVQQGLAAAEHDPGPADGLFGAKPSTRTRQAIRAWQAAKGMEETGFLTREQAETLIALGREAQAAQEEATRQAREADEARRRQQRQKQAGQPFRDELRSGGQGPQMMVVPAGSYQMGSPPYEEERDDDEGPVHRVTIAQPFAVGVYEVTVGAYGRFVGATGHAGGSSCRTYERGSWEERSGRSWRNPGFRQAEREPVVCVNWRDARAYTAWLSRETGKAYRLLSEAEWEYVARAETTTARYWGESEVGQCQHANGADQTASRHNSGWSVVACDDGHYRTALVGRFRPNGFGLYDVLGNVGEWTQDCWNESYASAPSGGRAWETVDCGRRVLRGGSWNFRPRDLRSANRGWSAADYRSFNLGFRIARSLP